jgi:hypothetical protein
MADTITRAELEGQTLVFRGEPLTLNEALFVVYTAVFNKWRRRCGPGDVF